MSAIPGMLGKAGRLWRCSRKTTRVLETRIMVFGGKLLLRPQQKNRKEHDGNLKRIADGKESAEGVRRRVPGKKQIYLFII